MHPLDHLALAAIGITPPPHGPWAQLVTGAQFIYRLRAQLDEDLLLEVAMEIDAAACRWITDHLDRAMSGALPLEPGSKASLELWERAVPGHGLLGE